jgi:hypothetical protein
MDTLDTLLAQMRRIGDEPADAAVAAARSDPVAAAALHRLARGEPLPPDVPAPVAALARQVDALPGWVDPGRLDRGSAAHLAVGPLWTQIVLGPGSLVDTYRAPGIAHALVRTGRLVDTARRRIEETGHWLASVVLPGGLAPGAPGRLATVQVRLLHARMRRGSSTRAGTSTATACPSTRPTSPGPCSTSPSCR